MHYRTLHTVLLVAVVFALAPMEKALPQEMCIPAPPDVKGLAWDGQALWVAVGPFGDGDVIQQINPNTGQVGASFAAPSRFPSGLTFDGQHLWQADLFGDSLYQINRTTGATIRTISAPGRVTGLTWDGATLWVYDDAATLLWQLDPNTEATLNAFRAPTSSGQGLAWDGQHLWLTSTFETFKIDPDDGDVFETIDQGSGRAVTFDGMGLRFVDVVLDEICRQVIDTSPGISMMLFPDGGNIALTQTFDLVVLAKTSGVSVKQIVFTFDFIPVTAFPPDPMQSLPAQAPAVVRRLAGCLVPGTVQSRPGQTFRCPGLSGQLLGVGVHLLRANAELNDGRTVSDALIWRVFDNVEP